jgi:hypothetical protein
VCPQSFPASAFASSFCIHLQLPQSLRASPTA